MTSTGSTSTRPVLLIGPPGVGKSTVAPLVARRLGRDSLDIDAMVEAETGTAIAELITERGESRFRLHEARALEAALSVEGAGAVLACGAGAPCDERTWRLARERGAVTILLRAPAERLARRLADQSHLRPLLDGPGGPAELEARLEALTEARAPWYSRCDATVDVTDDIDSAVSSIVEAIERVLRDTVPVRLGGESYAVTIGDSVDRLGELVSRRVPPVGAAARLGLIADERVALHYAERAEASLREAGYNVLTLTFPQGEKSKTWARAGAIIDGLLDAGVSSLQRGSPIVALGGGVTGDLAGLVASLLHRGCPLIQAPTSLLAMVDSSVGGKTAVNHHTGKNLIGAFHQPVLVYAALEALATQDSRSYRAGLAEVVKYGLLDSGWRLLENIERQADALLRRDLETIRPMVRECAEMKAKIVQSDPLDRTGERRALNLGHTLGQAIEAVGSYKRWLHGEAVAVGLLASARVGARLGLAPVDLEDRLAELFGRFGLPQDLDPLREASVFQRIRSDKKAESERVRYVVPVTAGGAELVSLTPGEIESNLFS